MQALRERPQVASSFGVDVRGYALFASRRTNVVAEDSHSRSSPCRT